MQNQVVRAACFRVGAGHVEAAEWLVADDGACAAAVEVKVSDMKFFARFFKVSAVAGDDGAG